MQIILNTTDRTAKTSKNKENFLKWKKVVRIEKQRIKLAIVHEKVETKEKIFYILSKKTYRKI